MTQVQTLMGPSDGLPYQLPFHIMAVDSRPRTLTKCEPEGLSRSRIPCFHCRFQLLTDSVPVWFSVGEKVLVSFCLLGGGWQGTPNHSLWSVPSVLQCVLFLPYLSIFVFLLLSVASWSLKPPLPVIPLQVSLFNTLDTFLEKRSCWHLLLHRGESIHEFLNTHPKPGSS